MLVFLEIGSRRVIFCNATAHPDSAWVAQQAGNVAWELEELKILGSSTGSAEPNRHCLNN